MSEIVISMEVNRFWLKEQQEKGEVPFAKVSDVLMKTYPNLVISVSGSKMEIKNVTNTQNASIRQCIKEFFSSNYEMSIAEGDYKLSARVFSNSQMSSANEISEPQSEVQKMDIPSDPVIVKADMKVLREEGYIEFPELEKFLLEYDVILKNAKRYKITDVIWSTNVLLSMDSGYGITTVNERIANVLENNGYIFSSKIQKKVIEYAIPGEYELADKYWGGMLNEIEHYFVAEQREKKRNNMPLIFSIDLSECMGGVNEKKLHENLEKLSKIKGSFLFVFRIPYVENIALNKMREVLSDLFLIRKIVVPPLSNTILLSYLKEKLKKNNLFLEENLDELLEKLITLEKQDGHFNGLKSMNRLATDIIYNKLSNEDNGERLILTKKDLLRTYNLLNFDEINPEEALSQLCGMESVKQTIDEIVAQIQLYKELKKEGKKLSAPTMHMRFVGNPGTGKTTVARLVAQIFREKGILNKGYFYEIKARDLCGRYVGETAPKTSGYCKDAMGSVLFIDEAYTLYRGKGSADYGQEAIETLITEMENNRDNLVIIMAGYKDEMDDLLKLNSGLASRMPYEIKFRNYKKEELVEIFYSMLGDNFSYTDGFDQALREFFDAIPDSELESSEFSNARMVRNLYERIWSKAAYRRSESNEKEIMLQEDDVQRAIADEEFRQLLTSKNIKIGF